MWQDLCKMNGCKATESPQVRWLQVCGCENLRIFPKYSVTAA
jgi:hypothetical protein